MLRSNPPISPYDFPFCTISTNNPPFGGSADALVFLGKTFCVRQGICGLLEPLFEGKGSLMSRAMLLHSKLGLRNLSISNYDFELLVIMAHWCKGLLASIFSESAESL